MEVAPLLVTRTGAITTFTFNISDKLNPLILETFELLGHPCVAG